MGFRAWGLGFGVLLTDKPQFFIHISIPISILVEGEGFIFRGLHCSFVVRCGHGWSVLFAVARTREVQIRIALSVSYMFTSCLALLLLQSLYCMFATITFFGARAIFLVGIHIYIYIYICFYIYIYVCVYIYIYTYIFGIALNSVLTTH